LTKIGLCDYEDAIGSYIEYEGQLPLEFYLCLDCTLQTVGDISSLFNLRKLK